MPMIDLIRRIQRGEAPLPPILVTLGIAFLDAEPGTARVAYTVSPRHFNAMGTLHGGILCDLADVAMGFAYAAALAEGEAFTTAELKINFLRPIRDGRLVATARVVHDGRTLALVECDVCDEAGKLVARVSSTCMKLAP